ncbi:MAG: hypothetical protein AAFP86_20315, partial [Planctomycetota bacterium]
MYRIFDVCFPPTYSVEVVRASAEESSVRWSRGRSRYARSSRRVAVTWPAEPIVAAEDMQRRFTALGGASTPFEILLPGDDLPSRLRFSGPLVVTFQSATV